VARLWTGKGDDGTTGLLFGGRVLKSSDRIEAVGALDEAQAAIGVSRAELAPGEVADLLVAVERDLWVLMAEAATDEANRSKLAAGTSLVTEAMVSAVEDAVSDLAARTELPTEFVVPGQDRASAHLDLARTVVRRAERAVVPIAAPGSFVVPYLNRLSTLLWTLARFVEASPLLSSER
jgi:cob(I)alamin adenosyltransferase